MDHQVTDCSGKADAVIKFRQFLPMCVRHAQRHVHQQIARDVCFSLIAFDVDAIRSGKHLPVDIFGVIAWVVATVFAELDTEPLERTGMQSGQKAFHNELRTQIQPRNVLDDFRFQVTFSSRHQIYFLV